MEIGDIPERFASPGIEVLVLSEPTKVDWAGLKAAGVISSDIELLSRLQDITKTADREEIWDSEGPGLAREILDVVCGVAQEAPVCSALYMAVLGLEENADRAQYFHFTGEDVEGYPYSAISRQFSSQEQCCLLSCRLLTLLLINRDTFPTLPSRMYPQVFRFIRSSFEGCDSPLNAATLLSSLLMDTQSRLPFVESQGIPAIVSALKRDFGNHQLQYISFFCTWLLSFTEEGIQAIAKSSGMLVAISDALRDSHKEKVVRMAVAVALNVIEVPVAAALFIEHKLPRRIEILAAKEENVEDPSDPEMSENIQALYEKIQEKVVNMSSFACLSAEALSGSLRWSPVHTSERFWLEEVDHFEENDYEVLRVMIHLLESADDTTVEVACHDIAHFAVHHHRGRKVLTQLGAKARLLALLDHHSPAVSAAAITTLQKVMLERSL